ncbi:MAG: hypothetical protein N4A63_02330 [Vallitalea sp.]|jgi:hypothetical protein|nr:hypothetical protein [Vallitalea sp.]
MPGANPANNFSPYVWGDDWRQPKEAILELPVGTKEVHITLQAFEDDEETCWGNFWGLDTYFKDFELIISDFIPPALKSINTNLDAGKYKEGTDIDFNVSFKEPVKHHSGSISLNAGSAYLGEATYVSGNKTDTLTYRYTVSSNDPSGKLKVKGFNNINISDTSGNPYKAGNISVQGNDIYIDTKAPDITLITTSKGEGWYKQGDHIDINVVFDEKVEFDDPNYHNISMEVETGLQAPGGQVQEHLLRYAMFKGIGASEDTLEFSYTIQSGDNTSEFYVRSVQGEVFDLAGNKASLGFSGKPLSDLGIKLDTTNPTILFNYDSELINIISKTHNVSITATDSGSGIENSYYYWSLDTLPPNDWGGVTDIVANNASIPNPTNVSGKYYLHVRSLDKAGNEALSVAGPFNIDNMKPTVELSQSSGEGKQNYFTVISVTDAMNGVEGSGVSSISYTWRKDKGTANERVYGPYFAINGETVNTPTVNASLVYSTKTYTDQDVTVTLITQDDSGYPVTITNNGGSNIYIYLKKMEVLNSNMKMY